MRFSQSTAVLALASTAAAVCKPKLDSEKIQADITTEKLWANLVALNDIALANGRNRAFGLPGYAASVDYVFNRISGHEGYYAWKQDFPALFAIVNAIDLTLDGEDVYVYGLTYSPSTPAEGLTGEIALGPEGAAGCTVAGYSGLNVTDKIVLIDRFRCPTGGTLAGRVVPAKQAGAKAVLIYSDLTTNVTAGSLSAPNATAFVPAGFINRVDGLRFRERVLAGETVEVFFNQQQTIETRVTQNVFVETEDGDPDNVIMLGAHLDSVQAGPGINDDGSGTTVLLEVFTALRKYRTRNKVRFAWWGAEENGLLGSRYYCQNLPADDVESLLVYLNFDMVSKGYYGVADTDGSTYGSVAPPGSDVVEHIYLDYYASKGLNVTAAVLTNGSDYASFWQVLNKPFGFLHTGTGVEQDPCYHQACDTIDNPNPVVLTNNARAAAHMLTVLSLNGTSLIPKSSVNATMLTSLQARDYVGPDPLQLRSLEAMGERHVGCGTHDL